MGRFSPINFCQLSFNWLSRIVRVMVISSIKVGYASKMRRYSVFIVLLLSFLIPLQVAASSLLSAQSCPTKVAMIDNPAINKAAPDCCDEENSKMDCQQMQTCHGCNISCQLFSFSTPVFNFTSNTSTRQAIDSPFVASFDPSAVWRPPTNS